MKNKFEKLKIENNDQKINTKKTLDTFDNISAESNRVAKIALNANIIISDLDRQFETATRLKKIDMPFLFLATGMHIVRQHLQNNYFTDASRKTDKEAAGQNNYNRELREKKLYYTTKEEILSNPVPFDTQNGAPFMGVDLGGGKGHRIATAGHEPIIGWVVGTANITTRTMTLLKPFPESYHVKYGNYLTKSGDISVNKNDYLYQKADFSKIIDYGIVKNTTSVDGISLLALALMKEAIHLKSDVLSKESLPLPFTSMNPDLARKLGEYNIDMASVLTVGKQASYAVAINTVIYLLHQLLITQIEDENPQFVQLRSRKILSYSNTIATTSNIIESAITQNVNHLDIGGFLVTLYRLTSDIKFQNKIKEEFLEKEFYKLVMNN